MDNHFFLVLYIFLSRIKNENLVVEWINFCFTGERRVPANGDRQFSLADRRYYGRYSRPYRKRKDILEKRRSRYERRDSTKVHSGIEETDDQVSGILRHGSVTLCRVFEDLDSSENSTKNDY